LGWDFYAMFRPKLLTKVLLLLLIIKNNKCQKYV
jgi:hypothetical protein